MAINSIDKRLMRHNISFSVSAVCNKVPLESKKIRSQNGMTKIKQNSAQVHDINSINTLVNQVIELSENIRTCKILNEQEQLDLVSIAINLFYTNNSREPPLIYELIFATADIPNLVKLRSACEQIYLLLQKFNVTKHNTVFKDEKLFSEYLQVCTHQAILFLHRIIKTEESFDSWQRQDISELLHETINNVELMVLMSKDMGAINKKYLTDTNEICNSDTKSVLIKQTVPSLTTNTLANTGIIAPDVSNSLNQTISASVVSSVFQGLAGVILPLNSRIQQDMSIIFKISLLVEKERVLKIVERLIEFGYLFTPGEQELLEKFFNLNKVNVLSSLINKEADIHTKFVKLMKFSSDNRKNIPTSIIEDTKLLNIICVTTATFKHTVTNYLKTAQYEKLSELINDNKDNVSFRNIIVNSIFEFDKFRGNLLTYLLLERNLHKGKLINEHNAISLILLESIYKEYQGYIEIYGLAHLKTPMFNLSDLLNSRSLQFFDYLHQYQTSDKYSCIQDITHIIFAIEHNVNLSKNDRIRLLDYLKINLDLKNNGLFVKTRARRVSYLENAALSVSYFNLFTIKSHVKESNASLLPEHLLGISIGSWITYSTMDTLMSLLKRGNTTTFHTIDTLVQAEYILANEDRVSANEYIRTNIEIIDLQILKYRDELILALEECNLLAIKQILSDLKNNLTLLNNEEDLLNKKEKMSKILHHILTDIYIGKNGVSFLLQDIIKTIEKEAPNNQKLSESTNSELKQLWKEIIGIRCKDSIIRINTSKIASMQQFKQILASRRFVDAKSALVGFSEIIGIIDNSTNVTSQKEMLVYFAGVLYKAKHDPTSNWHKLLKRDEYEEIALKLLLRVSAGVLWSGVVGTVFISKGFALVPAIMIIIATGGTKGLLNGLADSLTYANIIKTKEYKSAIKLLEDDDNELRDRVKKLKLNKFENKCYSENILSVRENFRNQMTKHKSKSDKDKNSTVLGREKVITKFITDHGKKLAEDYELTNQNYGADNFTIVNRVIDIFDSEVFDKYSANEALYNIIAVISYLINDKLERIRIILTVAKLFQLRSLGKIASIISTERDFLTQNNLLIGAVMSGVLGSVGSLVGLPDVGLATIYQTLIAGGSDHVSTMISKLGLNDYNSNNTKSFQMDMSFIKDIIMELLLETSIINEKEEIEPISKWSENTILYDSLVEFLGNNTSRFSKINDTISDSWHITIMKKKKFIPPKTSLTNV